MRAMVMAAAAALVLCGCGGDAAPADTGAAAPSRETPAPTPAAAAPQQAPAAPAGAQPTVADSTAAVAEDVSPEWKQRARTMESFASCMAKSREAPEEMRPNLEAACARLPSAPK